jgi:hypothetical protein
MGKREREKREEEFRGGCGSERHYIVKGGHKKTLILHLEGSQAFPASPSDRVGVDLRVLFNFGKNYLNKMKRFVRTSQETHYVSATSPTG